MENDVWSLLQSSPVGGKWEQYVGQRGAENGCSWLLIKAKGDLQDYILYFCLYLKFSLMEVFF